MTTAPLHLDGRSHRTSAPFAQTFEFAEGAFIVLSLCLFMGAATSLFLTDDQLTADDREKLRLLFLPIYAITVLLLLPRTRSILRSVREHWILALPCLAACISILWSIAPEITARRCVGLFFTTLFGVYLYERHSLAATVKLLAVACGAVVLLSYAMIVLVPAVGITPADGSWRGIFRQKNALGPCVCLAILALSLVEAGTIRQRAIRYLGLVLSALMLWNCGSRTSLVALLAVIPALMSIRSFRLGTTAGAALSLLILIAVYVGGAFALLNAASALDLLGKDTSLTGRVELWSMAETAIAEHPWLGYGYGAFWEAPAGPSRAIWEIIGWDAPNAHSGYLDMLLNIGMMGIPVVLLLFCTNIRNCVGALRNGWTLEAEWCLAVTLTTFFIAVDESSLFFEQNSVFWVIFVAVTMHARRACRAPRRRAPRPAGVSGGG